MRRRFLYGEALPPVQRYYNGWEHDMPEPDWTTMWATLPRQGQLWRDIQGNFYNSRGYSSVIYDKYDSNFNLQGTITFSGTKNNRGMPYIITNYKNRGYDVMVFTYEGQAAQTICCIRLDDFTNFTELYAGVPANTIFDNNAVGNAAIARERFASYFSGSSIFSKEIIGSLVQANASGIMGYLFNEDMTAPKGGWFLSEYALAFDPLPAISHFCASEEYVIALHVSNTNPQVVVFDFQTLIDSGWDWDAARLINFMGLPPNGGNVGYDLYYVYNDHLVLCDFYGKIGVYRISDGAQTWYRANASDYGGSFFWRNKIFRTNLIAANGLIEIPLTAFGL